MALGIPDISWTDNTDERTPLVLVLDCSGSMSGENISELNAGLVVLESDMKNDPTTSTRGRVLVIQYGWNDEVRQELWQDAIDFKAPKLEADGRTPMGAAVTQALAEIEAQKAELRANGIPYKRPIMMLLSDGEPSDSWEQAAEACKAAEANNKVSVYAIGVGKNAKLDILNRFSAKGAKQLSGTKFKELFIWVSASVKAVSQTAKGNVAQNPATDTWASSGPV